MVPERRGPLRAGHGIASGTGDDVDDDDDDDDDDNSNLTRRNYA